MIKVTMCLSTEHLEAFHETQIEFMPVHEVPNSFLTDYPAQVELLKEIKTEFSHNPLVVASIDLKIKQLEDHIKLHQNTDQCNEADELEESLADSYALNITGLLNAGVKVLEALANKFNSQAELNNIRAEDERSLQSRVTKPE